DDPVADDGSIDGVIEAVVAMARQINCRPIFYQISPRFIPSFLDNGFRLYKLGEEAVVDLETFSLDGKARRGLRGSHNRAERDGLTFDIRQPPHDPAFLDTLRAISDEWLADKGGVEKDFSVGRFSDAYIGRFPVAVVSLAGTPVAFANLLVTDTRAMATIDLMRHRDDAPTSVMEFLFVEIMLALKADGFAAFSLGLAPLSGFETMRRKRLWEHSAQLVYEHGNRFYSFKGLRAFKDKFKPEWVPRYAAAYSTVDFVAGLADATALINAPSKPAESGDDGP
ncbi:MAG: GNAT family N-acetyltransferase, partial [Rhodobiaceae bacterium]|nr:GNAT family N-acetyltransferase [Rhodobiaceae bacterium]